MVAALAARVEQEIVGDLVAPTEGIVEVDGLGEIINKMGSKNCSLGFETCFGWDPQHPIGAGRKTHLKSRFWLHVDIITLPI